jgi:hypothetical protein
MVTTPQHKKEMERIEQERLEDALGPAVAVSGQTPPSDDLSMSARLVAQLRGEPRTATEGK